MQLNPLFFQATLFWSSSGFQAIYIRIFGRREASTVSIKYCTESYLSPTQATQTAVSKITKLQNIQKFKKKSRDLERVTKMAQTRHSWDIDALLTELERTRPGLERSSQAQGLAYEDATRGYCVSICERIDTAKFEGLPTPT